MKSGRKVIKTMKRAIHGSTSGNVSRESQGTSKAVADVISATVPATCQTMTAMSAPISHCHHFGRVSSFVVGGSVIG